MRVKPEADEYDLAAVAEFGAKGST